MLVPSSETGPGGSADVRRGLEMGIYGIYAPKNHAPTVSEIRKRQTGILYLLRLRYRSYGEHTNPPQQGRSMFRTRR